MENAVRRGEDTELVVVMNDVIAASARVDQGSGAKGDEWKPLYFAIQGALIDRIGRVPKKTVEWVKVARLLWSETFEDPELWERYNQTHVRSLGALTADVAKNRATPWRDGNAFIDFSRETLRDRMIK
jgi:hypothetical protein